MTEGSIPALSPLDDRSQVRIFTLAEYVAEDTSGKLLVGGAGLEWTGVPVRSEADGTSQILPCYLLIRLAFPRASARPSHEIVVHVVNQDGSSAGPDPLLQATMRFDLDRTPKDFAEVSGNLPVQITGYPTTSDPNGVIFLQLKVDGVVVSRLPVQLQSIDP